MQRDRPGLLEVVLDDGGDEVAVEVGETDGVGARVGPVQVRIHPVDSEAVGRDDVVIYDHFLLVAFVNGCPAK